MIRRSLVAAVGVLSTATILGAATPQPGVVFEVTTVEGSGAESRTEVNTIQIQGSNLAMAMVGNGSEGRVIYLGDRNELIIEDHTDGSYTRIDQNALDELTRQVNAAMAQLEEMLAGLPEAQREMMREMQAQSGMTIPGMGDAEKPTIEVRSSGRSDTRAGYPVREWELVQDGRVEQRMWVTPWSEIDAGAEVRDAFTGMATFFDAFLEAIPSMPGATAIENPFASLDVMGGMPVVTEDLAADGSVESTSEVTGVERRSIDPATFQPTPGLTERPLPSMGG